MKNFVIILLLLHSLNLYSQEYEFTEGKEIASVYSVDELICLSDYLLDSAIVSRSFCIEYTSVPIFSFKSHEVAKIVQYRQDYTISTCPPPIFYNIFPKYDIIASNINIKCELVQEISSNIEDNYYIWDDQIYIYINPNLNKSQCIQLYDYAKRIRTKYSNDNYFSSVLYFSIIDNISSLLFNNKCFNLKNEIDSILILNYQSFSYDNISNDNYKLVIEKLNHFNYSDEILRYVQNNLIDYSEIDTVGLPLDLKNNIGKNYLLAMNSNYADVFNKINKLLQMYPDVDYSISYKNARTDFLMMRHDKWAFFNSCFKLARKNNDKYIFSLLEKVVQEIDINRIEKYRKESLLNEIKRYY